MASATAPSTRLITLLADARAPVGERNQTLKWSVHLVADLYQPLHAADNDDRGGNRVPVALSASLHKVWDNDLVRRAFDTRGPQTPPGIAALAREAHELAGAAGQGSPQQWARQSNYLARNLAYRYPGFTCHELPGRIVVLDAACQQDAADVVRERVLLAGARLAVLLNRMLTA